MKAGTNTELLRQAEMVCEAAQACARLGWVPATAGNFSFRDAESGRAFISASGLDKGAMTPVDLVEMNLLETDLLEMGVESHVLGRSASPEASRPSAEASLHRVIYRHFPAAGAIFHVHTIWNTLISDRFAEAVPLENYELLKALSGVTTHLHCELVPILENSQDYDLLAGQLDAALRKLPAAHGVLLRRHGLYVWGESVAGTRRHLEALEFLFEVECRRLMAAVV